MADLSLSETIMFYLNKGPIKPTMLIDVLTDEGYEESKIKESYLVMLNDGVIEFTSDRFLQVLP